MSAYDEAYLEGDLEAEETLEESLFEVIFRNDLEAATLLVTQSDVDVSRPNGRGKTMLGLAVEHEHVPMVQMLMENGADINQPSFCSNDYSFQTPVVTAARIQHEELLTMFLTQKCELDRGAGKDGKSALQWAASHGNLGMMKVLYAAGADVNWTGPFCNTALHYATIANKPDIIQWLLGKGAEVTVNGEGRSALHIACVKGYSDIMTQLLLARCEVDLYDSFGFSPFSLACLRGHLDMVRDLMQHARPGTKYNMEDALHRAAECGHLEVLEFLIHKGADVNSVNSSGESALSIAARGQPVSVKLLLENKAVINVVDKRGYSPLQHAILREQIDVAMCLIKHGSNLHTTSSLIDSPLQSGYSTSNPLLIKCLIDAGVTLGTEKWFTVYACQTKLRELDFQYNSLRYRHTIDAQRDVWQWVMGKIGKPRSLLEACRTAARTQLVTSSGGRSILANIHQLPLPTALKKYLALEDYFRI